MDTSLLWPRDGDPGVTTSFTINWICRLILGPLGLLFSWVPFYLLRRNGEFAACVMVATNWILIVYLYVNALIWHNEDIEASWGGQGWCDIQMYTQFAMTTIYSACVCAIMRRLAKSVGLERVTTLTAKERKNRIFVQSLIIFPAPIIQVILTPFVQGHPYTLMPVNGCGKAFDGNVIYLIFFVIPSPIYTAAACVYACKSICK